MTRQRSAAELGNLVSSSAVLLLFLVAAFGTLSSSPVSGATLLVSPSGYSLTGRSLLLEGVDVGAALITAQQVIAQLKETVQQQQIAIDMLTAKVGSLLTWRRRRGTGRPRCAGHWPPLL